MKECEARPWWGGHAPEDVYLVSVMPCVRKKGESDRPEFTVGGVRDVDEVGRCGLTPG